MPDLAQLWYATRFRLAVWRRTHLHVCVCGHTRAAHIGTCGACPCNGYRRVPAWSRAAARVMALLYGDQDQR